MIETTLERIVLDDAMGDGDWVGTKEENIARRAALAAVKLLWAEVDRRWSFNVHQGHTHTWHDKEDLRGWLFAEFPGGDFATNLRACLACGGIGRVNAETCTPCEGTGKRG